MEERTSGSRVMSAPLERVLAVIADIEGYPRWATQFTDARVLERANDGRPRVAEFVMNAGLIKDTFTLQYTFTQGAQGATVVWQLKEARLLKKLDGLYRLTPDPEGTAVHYELEVDPGLPVLTMLRRRAEATVIRTALEDLADAVESAGQ